MKEDLTSRVLNGEKVYPYMEGKIVRLSVCYDLREHYKYILKQKEIVKELEKNNYKEITSFSHFNRLMIEDITFLNIIKKYFNINKILISDKDCDYIYGIDLLDEQPHNYTLRLVEGYCNLNRGHFFNDYIDIFGNKITFK